jgi:hypothetical protein
MTGRPSTSAVLGYRRVQSGTFDLKVFFLYS